MGVQSSIIKLDKDNRKLGCVLNTFTYIIMIIFISEMICGNNNTGIIYTSSPTYVVMNVSVRAGRWDFYHGCKIHTNEIALKEVDKSLIKPAA